VTGDPISKFADVGETLPPFTTLYVTTNGCGVDVVDVTAAALVPVWLFATTENLYSVPFVKPAILHVVAGAVTVHVRGPGTGLPEASSAVTV
jgi:hypothetical protein